MTHTDEIPRIDKDPGAVLDYAWNWGTSETNPTPWLADDEVITMHSVEVQDADGNETDTVTIEGTSDTSTVVTAWVSGGTPETTAYLVCHIETNQGREDERTIILNIVNR